MHVFSHSFSSSIELIQSINVDECDEVTKPQERGSTTVSGQSGPL